MGPGLSAVEIVICKVPGSVGSMTMRVELSECPPHVVHALMYSFRDDCSGGDSTGERRKYSVQQPSIDPYNKPTPPPSEPTPENPPP